MIYDNDGPIYSMLNGKPGDYCWPGNNSDSDYNNNPYPPVTFTVAGTADGVDYYTGSINVQTGPEAYMISEIVYYLYRVTFPSEYFPDGYGNWQIRKTNMDDFGPPDAFYQWYGTPTSTPPLSGWSSGSLASGGCS